MSEWALAIELDSLIHGIEHQAQARTNGTALSSDQDGNGIMRRLTVTLNTSTPPSRQLLTIVKCCQCG
jgi:hypothetical protein